jgi:hypothetical protein
MAAFGASDAVIHVRSRRRTAVALMVALPVILGIACEVFGAEDLNGYVAVLGLFEAIAFFLLPAVLPADALGGERRGPLRADRTGVFFRSKLLLRRENVRGLWIEPKRGGARTVYLAARRARDDVAIEVEDDERVRSLLEALDLHRDRHASRFFVYRDPLRTRAERFGARAAIAGGAAAILAGIFFLFQSNPFAILGLVPFLILYAIAVKRARRKTEVMLGTDGVVVRAGGRLRTIGLTEIRAVRAHAETAIVVLENEAPLTLQFAEQNPVRARDAFVVALQHRLPLREENVVGDHLASLLTRGERSGSEWIRDIAQTAGTAEAEGYRVAPVPDETLWRIVEHAAADPTARAGALVALGERLDDEGRARIRELASATTRADLRAALEAAASGESAEGIVDALDAKRRT